MKHLILILSVTLLFTACKDEQTKIGAMSGPVAVDQLGNAVSTDLANFTTIEWIDPIEKEIGKIKKGQKVEVTYHFKNTGDKPLIINSVNPGCGCTIAEKPEKPIPPGKEDKIVAVFNTKSQAVGTQIKQVHVSANTTPATEHTLTFKGEVYE